MYIFGSSLIKMQHLTGHYEAKLDESFRFNFPAAIVKKIFNNAPPAFAISLGEGYLKLHTEERWKQILDKLKPLNDLDPLVRDFKTRITLGSEIVNIDKAGKISLPVLLREILKDETEIIINGAITHFEIWNKTKFNEKYGLSAGKSLEELTGLMVEKYGINFNVD